MASGTALAGKLAIVSGASSGVGKTVALALLGEGCRVVGIGRRAEAPPEFAAFAGMRYLAIDLAQQDVVATLRREAPDALEAVSVLVNCAGHDQGGGAAFHEHCDEDWPHILRVNAEATMQLTHACLPAMVARDAGDIVMIGSITALRPARRLAAYTASKHAVHGFAEALRLDYCDTGLRIVELMPGVIRTTFAGRRWQGDERRAAEFYSNFAGCLEADDVARAVMYALHQPAHVSIAEMVLLPTREHP